MRGAVLSACEQSNARRGAMLFVQAMAALWQKLDQASEWGPPQQIESKLRQFVGVYATIPEFVPGLRADSYHGLGLAIAFRVAVAGANTAKAVALLEIGITAESLANSGGTDLVQALAIDEARHAKLDRDRLARNWERARQTVRQMIPAIDTVTLSACVRDESVRAAPAMCAEKSGRTASRGPR